MNESKYYEDVLRMVSKGLTISESLKKLKVDSSRFYKSISETQKKLLKNTKVLNQKSFDNRYLYKGLDFDDY